MGHSFENTSELTVAATPEEVWDAIATGPGVGSWYMGPTTVEGGEHGTITMDLGGFEIPYRITAYEPSKHFAYREAEEPDGRFFGMEFLIEGREQGSTVVRVVGSGFIPGDDWESEYDAMTKGGDMYLATLGAYLQHFTGRTGFSLISNGEVPAGSNGVEAFERALGLSAAPAEGDPVHAQLDGVGAVDGVVDIATPDVLGVRTDDALYRFGAAMGQVFVSHHLFADDAPKQGPAWEEWLARLS